MHVAIDPCFRSVPGACNCRGLTAGNQGWVNPEPSCALAETTSLQPGMLERLDHTASFRKASGSFQRRRDQVTFQFLTPIEGSGDFCPYCSLL